MTLYIVHVCITLISGGEWWLYQQAHVQRRNSLGVSGEHGRAWYGITSFLRGYSCTCEYWAAQSFFFQVIRTTKLKQENMIFAFVAVTDSIMWCLLKFESCVCGMLDTVFEFYDVISMMYTCTVYMHVACWMLCTSTCTCMYGTRDGKKDFIQLE